MSELPEGWAIASLASISSKIVDGSHHPPPKMPTGKPMLSAVNIDQEKILFSQYRLIEPERWAEEDRRTNIAAGDVLLTIVGAIGRAAVVPDGMQPFTLQRSVAVFRPRGILPQLLMHQLHSPRISKFLEAGARGTAQQGVYLKTLATMPVFIPPLCEQRRIVAKIEELFSELDESVESLTRAHAQLKTYRQALLKAAFEGKLTADWRAANFEEQETLEKRLSLLRTAREHWYRAEESEASQRRREWEKSGSLGPSPSSPERYRQALPISAEELSKLPELPSDWTYVRLMEIACVGSGMSVSKGRSLDDPVDAPYLRVANVQRGFLDLTHIRTMQVERSQLASLALRKYDVLFNEGGDRDKLGRGWVWDGLVSPCITQNHVFRATLFKANEASAKLLSHWGNTQGRDYFDKGGKQTTNLASINKTVLGALPVPFIPDDEAAILFSRLEAVLSTLDVNLTEIDLALSKISVLRQAILKKAFSGQLVPQDPSDEPAAALLVRLRAEPTDANSGRKTRRKQLA